MPSDHDDTPLPRLSQTVDYALIAVDVDSESASWLPFVRAAVRRTRRRLFVLFKGNGALYEPSQALTDVAAAALEVVASESRPQLCVVPLFATAGWAEIVEGQVPHGAQAEILCCIEVVFVAAPRDAGGNVMDQNSVSDHPEESAGQHDRYVASGGQQDKKGRVVYHQKTMAGSSGSAPPCGNENSREAAATVHHVGQGAAQESDATISAGHGGGPSCSSGSKPMQSELSAAEDNSDSLGFAVVLAEALSTARQSSGVDGCVAIGSIEAAHPNGGNPQEDLIVGSADRRAWRHVAVGGTFDRLHAGHRILLAATAITATEAAYVGITGPALLQNKNHRELLQTFAARESAVTEYLRLVRPGLSVHTAELHDPKGLAAEVAEIEALVVSTETAKGAKPINQDRLQRGFAPLQVVTVSLVGATGGAAAKLSSTTLRAEEAALQGSHKDGAAAQEDW